MSTQDDKRLHHSHSPVQAGPNCAGKKTPREAPDREVTEFTRRRRKLPHWQKPGAIYYITVSLRVGSPVCLSREDIAPIIVQSLRFDDGIRYRLHAYVIMPDHIHLLIEPLPRGKGYVPLPEIMQALKGVTSHRINRRLGRRGPMWLDESYDRIPRHEQEYAQKMRYIRNNPVKAGLVEQVEEWHWVWAKHMDPPS